MTRRSASSWVVEERTGSTRPAGKPAFGIRPLGGSDARTRRCRRGEIQSKETSVTAHTPVRTAMPGLRVMPQTVGFRCVLNVAGEIDIATADILRSALERARESGRRDIWVDLSDVTFMDYSGLNALVRADHDFAGHNG